MAQMNNRNLFWLIPIGVIAFFVAISLVAVMFWRGFPYPAFAGPGPWYVWWFPFGFFLFIPVVFLFFFAIRWFFWGAFGWGRWGYHYGGYGSALEILGQRYARGEITKEQYDQMRNDLEQNR